MAARSIDAKVVGLYAATFYLAELVLSPLFGIISDRYGHHRIMVFGPVFGAIAVILTGLTPPSSCSARSSCSRARRDAHPRGRLERRERAVDPRLHRDGDRRQRGPPRQDLGPLRGRDAGRSRTRRDRRRQAASRPRSGRRPSSSTPLIYGVSFPIYSFGVKRPGRRGGGASPASTSGSTATSPSSARRTSCCSRRPGSRSTRPSGSG